MLQKELDFMRFFRENLSNRTQANYQHINTASRMIGRSGASACSNCMRSEYLELLNIYNRLLPAFNSYKEPEPIVEEPLPDVFTRYEAIDDVYEKVKNLEDDKELIIRKGKKK